MCLVMDGKGELFTDMGRTCDGECFIAWKHHVVGEGFGQTKSTVFTCDGAVHHLF